MLKELGLNCHFSTYTNDHQSERSDRRLGAPGLLSVLNMSASCLNSLTPLLIPLFIYFRQTFTPMWSTYGPLGVDSHNIIHPQEVRIPKQHIISRYIIFRLNTPKGSSKALGVDPLMLNTLRDDKIAFHNEHPHQYPLRTMFYRYIWPQGTNVCVSSFRKQRSLVKCYIKWILRNLVLSCQFSCPYSKFGWSVAAVVSL